MKFQIFRGWQLAVAGACAIAFGATVAAQNMQINGAGATFPDPIYQKWFSEYNKLHPTVKINYQPLGSGAGIRQLQSNTVFFGATEVWLALTFGQPPLTPPMQARVLDECVDMFLARHATAEAPPPP